jgi:hypothetical protein
MNTSSVLLSSQAEPATFTDLAPQSFSAACWVTLEAIKVRIVRKFTVEFSDLKPRLVRQAVEEAFALASLTEVPQLLFPTLAEEKVQSVRYWSRHQEAIRHHTGFALAAA